MAMRTRILLVDDAAVVRTTIRALLEQHSFEICGEAANGEEAVQQVRDLKPDMVIMDINMPVMNGVQAALAIRRMAPETYIVFLTAHAIPGVMHALRQYSDGFVCKTTVGRQLIPLLGRLAITPYKKPNARVRTAVGGKP